MTTNTDQQPKATVFHDGECPMCSREIALMRKIDVSNAIHWVDITKDKQALADAGITYQQAMDRIHVADASQQLHTGIKGFMNVWEHLPYYRRLVPVIRHTPLLLPIMEAVYKVFAKNRLRLTGRQKAR